MNKATEFDINNTNQYRLSIQVSLDGFSFLVFSPHDDIVLAAKELPIKISSPKFTPRHFNDWINSEPILKLPFKIVDILVFEENFTLVPTDSGLNDLMKVPVDLLINTDNDRLIFEEHVESIGAMLCFGVLREFTEVVTRFFTKVNWIHPVSLLINHFPAVDKPNQCILVRAQNFVYLILKKRNRLMLANCFRAEYSSDIVYYVLNTFRQLGVSRNQSQLWVDEIVDYQPGLIELINPYFASVSRLSSYSETVYFAGSNRLHLFFNINEK